MSGAFLFATILGLVLVCSVLGAIDAETRRQLKESRKQNPVEERKEHFGMTKDDFEWIQQSKTLILDEIAARRGRNVNITQFAPQSDSLQSNQQSNNLGTGKSPTVWDDIVLSRPQMEYLLHRLGLDSDSESSTKKRVKRKIDNFETFPNQMWDMPIKYVVSSSFTVQGAALIDKAVAQWMKETCVVFEKHDPSEYLTSQYLYILQDWDGCWSYLGEQDPEDTFPQYISLSESLGCLKLLGTPMHELGHALGLLHEQCRPDRDDTVTINWSNIDSDYWAQFEEADLIEAQTYGVPYDVGSLMHYGSTAFAYYSGLQTITPRDSSLLQVLGQRTELSFYDVAIVNNNYCGGVCVTKLPCQNGGYTDPKNCSVCRCPDGWGGTLCGDFDHGSPICSPHSGDITVTSNTQCIQSPGYGANTSYTPGTACTWKLVVPHNETVAMWFNGTEFGLYKYLAGCQHYVEVRHSPGHVTRGQRFCGYTMPPYTSSSPIYSTLSNVTVLFKTPDLSGSYQGWYPVMPSDGYYNGFQLCFKTAGADPCHSNPCINNGTCVRQGVDFMCECDARHEGQRCELNQTQTIRLRDGNNQLQGRLEILYNNTWGTVCNYYFSVSEARVACRQLGYSGGSVLYRVQPGTGPIWLDYVSCTGNETSLFDCFYYLGNDFFGCSHYYDVGVSCTIDVCASNPCVNGGTCVSSTTTYMCNCLAGWYGQNCERVDDRTIRLSDGVNQYEGRVEVSVNGVWGTVCDDGFDVKDAAMACRQLGFVGGTALAAARVLDGSGQIWLDSVVCTGSESNLTSCSHKPLGINDCTHREDVGLRCALPCTSSPCLNNGVCLQYFGGRNPGQVCVCPANYTNTYCQDVDYCVNNPCKNGGVCYNRGANYTCVCRAGFAGNKCEYVDNCASYPCLYGTCITTSNTTFTCICQPGYTGSNCNMYMGPQIRLAGGTTYRGRVELLYNGAWGTMCDDGAGTPEAIVACRQLGFSGGTPLYAAYGDIPRGSGTIWLDNVDCNGNELNLDACYHNSIGNHNCDHYEDFGVECSMPSSVSTTTTTTTPLETTHVTDAPAIVTQPTTLRPTTARPATTTARPTTTTTRPTTTTTRPTTTTTRPTTTTTRPTTTTRRTTTRN